MNHNLQQISDHAGISWQDSEGMILATVTEAQLWDFANILLTQCQQTVLNCKVIYTSGTNNPEEFQQWNRALNMAVRQLDTLLEHT